MNLVSLHGVRHCHVLLWVYLHLIRLREKYILKSKYLIVNEWRVIRCNVLFFHKV